MNGANLVLNHVVQKLKNVEWYKFILFTNIRFVNSYPWPGNSFLYIQISGYGALSGKMLLVRIVEKKMMLILGQIRLSKS